MYLIVCLPYATVLKLQEVKCENDPSGPSGRSAYPVFCSIKRLGILYSPLDGMLVCRRLATSVKFTRTHIYTRVERCTVRVKCLTLEHNTMIQVTVPLTLNIKSQNNKVFLTAIKPTFSIVSHLTVIDFLSHVICINIS